MKSSRVLAAALCAGIASLVPISALADPLTPSALLASAQAHDGQSVSVTGTVKGFTTRQGRRGTIATFQVCDQQCVNAADLSGTTQTEGATVTLTGTIHAAMKTRQGSQTNVIVIAH
jgi:cytochrome c-type biogenesis protein CcmE